MKVGELYEVKHKWLLPISISDFWSDCGPVLYLGEEGLIREDGTKIVNHAVFVKGQRRFLAQAFLLEKKIEKIFKQSHKVMRASKVSCVLNTSNDEMIDDLVFIHGTTRNTMSDYYQSYIKQLSAEQES